MSKLNSLDWLFIVWSFLLQIALIGHFAIRRVLFESYTLRYGWIVYALCLPALIISVLLLRGGMSWHYWIGGFIYLLFASVGYWIDYVAKIQFRSPFKADVGIPYIVLYLGSVMFYWFPLANLSRPLWWVYGALFVVATVLNITSH